jgi:type I restriction enzyme, R subunit
MHTLGGEVSAVQTPLVEYAQQVGWEHISEEQALEYRGGEGSLLFKEIFAAKMHQLNHDYMTSDIMNELVARLERVPASMEGNLATWEYLRGLKTVFVPSQKRELNVRFIDTDNIDNNAFHMTREFSYTNGDRTIRLDIVFLINGIPILFVETKSAHKMEGIAEALEQVRRYHRVCPEMAAILQLYSLTHLLQYYYSATWNLSTRTLFNWKEEATGRFEDLVKSFFDRRRIVKVITDYIMFTRKDDELKKVVLRPHQFRAVEKIVQRALDEEKRSGLVWHTQGSGKTYTMIVAAKKILENPVLESPTVIMLVDRNELETQLFNNLTSVGIENVHLAESREHLQELLQTDKRGLVVSMIHKFDGMKADVNTRHNIFVLVDEAHRTTEGKLGNYLMGALPNATYIGFTGTPIDRTAFGKGTFLTFGKDDPPRGYLDKYSISESIEDGTTIPLHYSLAPNELKVDRATLENEFLALKEAQGLSDVQALNKILERAVNLRNMLKNKERVREVAEYVAKNFRNNVEKLGYKAFLVAVDREACALYKEELDRQGIIPPEYTEVVYSAGFNDPVELARYHLTEEQEKRIRKSFVHPEELPKILIVTEKLLTGFDAPILYCIYLDKPMRDHVLLQTIARVNRPYEDDYGRKKPSGFVLDFVGIFDNLEKALAFDSSDIKGIVEHIDTLKEEFARMMEEAKTKYLSIIEGKKGDKAVEAVLEAFLPEETRQKYYDFYEELEDIYDIISPDAFLRPYVDDFDTLARMYAILKEAYDRGLLDRELSRKVGELVREHTKSGAFQPAIEVFRIDEDTLRKLEDSRIPDTKKVFNLLKSLNKHVLDNGAEQPYLRSIGERAEMIAAAYMQRQTNTQEALKKLKELVEEIDALRHEQAEMGMNSDVFSVYYLLRKSGIDSPEEKAYQIGTAFEKHLHWKKSESHEREVRKEMYKVTMSTGMKNAVELVNHILRILKESAQ